MSLFHTHAQMMYTTLFRSVYTDQQHPGVLLVTEQKAAMQTLKKGSQTMAVHHAVKPLEKAI